jgi:hypothetical protein
MFGLSFAAVLSLLVTPVMYAIFFGIHESDDAGASPPPTVTAPVTKPVA